MLKKLFFSSFVFFFLFTYLTPLSSRQRKFVRVRRKRKIMSPFHEESNSEWDNISNLEQVPHPERGQRGHRTM